MFVIAVEGTKTEPSYFARFNDQSVIHVSCLKGDSRSSPTHVLQRMERYLQRSEIAKSDEAT